jgi:hypothetical protein
MTNQEVISQEDQSPRRKKVVGLIGVVAAGFALCAVMKTIVCWKLGDSCPCQGTSDQSDFECPSLEKE